MSRFWLLFLTAASLSKGLIAGESCAYDLIELQQTEVVCPREFQLRVASPRLLLGTFPNTPDQAIVLLDRQSWESVGSLVSCRASQCAWFPIYLDRDAWCVPIPPPNELGRGIGTEAKYAVLVHAFSSPDIDVVYARIEGDNERSLRLHRRLGFAQIDRSEVHPSAWVTSPVFTNILYFRLTREDFLRWDATRDKSPAGIQAFFRLAAPPTEP